jgi:hypothetical protein
VTRCLVLLDTRYPDVSRMTRYRISKEPNFPTPIIVRGRKYYDSDELTEWEESRRLKDILERHIKKYQSP